MSLDGVSPLPTPKSCRDSFDERLAAIWAEVLNGNLVQDRVEFFNQGGDSLLAIRLVLRMQKEFGILVPAALLFRHPTLEQFTAAIRARGLAVTCSDGRAEHTPCLVPIHASGSGPRLFCIGGATTDASMLLSGAPFLAKLAEHFGPDQPVFNLCFEYGPDGPEMVLIEHIAAAFLQDVCSVQPAGPYFLAGWSFGGLVAFEMAQQLRAAGQAVELLVLFDSTAQGYPARRTWAQVMLAAWRRWRACRGIERLTYPVVELAGAIWEAGMRFRRWVGRLVGVQNPWKNVARMEAAYLSNLTPYPGPMTLFVAAEALAETECQILLVPDPTLGWQGFAAGIDMHTVPGDHHSMFQEPGLTQIANVLRTRLARASLIEEQR